MPKVIKLKNDTFLANELYSEREIMIGTWIDGKPIYRKVIVYNHQAGESESKIETNIKKINTVVNIYGMQHIANSWRPISVYYPSNYDRFSQSIYSIGGTPAQIFVFSSSWYAEYDSIFYIVIEYTKT